jgi:peptidoglycan hydrolase-like protein with peptidoglycan-binding domain
MMKSRIARFAGVAAGVAFALSLAPVASAQTMSIAQLQAQIAALMAQLQAMQGGSASVGATFNTDLTIGSSGADVTALQNWLISKGFSIPAGATGYFGSQTQAAVAAWQTSAGITPAAGYFGPKSRAAVNAMASTGGTSTGGTTTTGTTGGTSGVITTPGKEGVLTVTAGPLSNTVANVGQTMVPILTIRAQAQNSDIDVQRVTVDLGTNTAIYNKIYSNLYVVDNATGNVLASTPLNGSTVLQSGNNYIATIAGFHFVVPAGTYKDLALKADLYSSIDSSYVSGGISAVNTTVSIDTNGVRGIDGAGIDQFGPTTGSISQSITINKSLVDNAQGQLAIAPSTPLANSFPVTDTINGQLLQMPLMVFNLTAQNDTLHIHQLQVTVTGNPTGNSTATATAAYLYNGSTQVGSASINTTTGIATFSNITDGTAGASVPVGTTVPFTIKTDVTGVTAGSIALSGVVSGTGTTIYNSEDSSITITGSATGQTQTVLGKGPSFTLLSTSVTKSSTPINNNIATSTLSATFNIQVQAIGSNVLFGDQASATPAVVFGIYKGGNLTTLAVASTSSVSLPSAGVTIDTVNHSFTVPQNSTVTLPYTFLFEGRTNVGNLVSTDNYAVGIEKFQWVASGTAASTTFTSGQTAWRTSTQPLP